LRSAPQLAELREVTALIKASLQKVLGL